MRKKTTLRRLIAISLALIALSAASGYGQGAARASDATVPGKLLVDNPTIHNLAFRWLIEGDENANATVGVKYRKRGETQWRPALSMLRIFREEAKGTTTGNLFAGSVLNLQPATTYEVQFDLADPDGGRVASEGRCGMEL